MEISVRNIYSTFLKALAHAKPKANSSISICTRTFQENKLTDVIN